MTTAQITLVNFFVCFIIYCVSAECLTIQNMNESIKLKASITSTATESDSEQYHEIDQEAITKETSFTLKSLPKNVNEYDFFTQYQDTAKDKRKGKKKKEKNKKGVNLMDIINSELAETEPPLSKNVITLVKNDKKENKLYQKDFSLQNLVQKRHLDIERGYTTLNPVKLSPIFPKILENTVTKDIIFYTQYVQPVMFNNIVESYAPTEHHVQTQKFIDIEIKNMKFSHHHKFSLESLLLTKLSEHYNEYLSIQKRLKEISKNVKVSRSTKNNLKQQLLQITSDRPENVRFDATVLKYTEKLFYYKNIYTETVKKEKESIHRILSLWSDVELVREKKNSSEINIFLEINKTTLSESDYQEQWNNLFEMEYTDMLDNIEYEYAILYLKYKEIKTKLKVDDSMKQKICRPKLVIDESKIKTDAEVLVNQKLAREKIEIVLKCSKGMKDLLKPIQVLSADEYTFNFFVDDVFVCESDTYTYKDLMNVLEISELFSIQILPKNKTLQVALYENEIKVSYAYVNLEDIKHKITIAEFVSYDFVYKDYTAYPNNKFVGSGHTIKEIAVENKVRLRSSNVFKGSLMTTCKVSMKIGWNEKFNENSHEAVLASVETGRQIKLFLQGIKKPKLNDLLNIINDVYKRNVEEDEKIVKRLQDVCKEDIVNDYTFVVDDKSDDNIRLKLLYLRNNGGFGNVENQLVPLVSSQISTEQLSCLQNANDKLIDIQNLDDEKDLDPIDLQRYIGMKYVKKLNENLQNTWHEFLLQKTHKDVVKDFRDLSWRGLLTNRSNLMSLSVSSFMLRQQLQAKCSAEEQEIQVTVLRAFNLPDRVTGSLSDDDDDSERIAGFKVRPLRPYVKMSYRGASAQSAPGIGCYPSWNQTIKIKTRFEPLSSIQLNVYDECKEKVGVQEASGSKTLQYQCFSGWLGTLLVPLGTVLTAGTLRGTFKLTSPPMIIGYENPTPKESRSLIPDVKRMLQKDVSFLTLHITTSLSHLGGAQAYSQPVPNLSDDDRIIKHLNEFVTEYLNEFPSRSVSLTHVDSDGKNRCVTEFLQPIPLPDPECYPRNPKRSGSAVSKSSSSKSSVRGNFETNITIEEEREQYSAFDVNNWRNQEDQLLKAVNMCLRYVSLIPIYEGAEQAVALTGLELLKVLYGSPTDHAVLLASYFLHLGIKCWVVNGFGLPLGLSSYVLVKYDIVTQKYVTVDERTNGRRKFFGQSEDCMWQLFDASSGERFELRDIACPLKTVLYVYNEDNIWLNIQSSLECESVCFDFSKSSDWRPVFDKLKPLPRQPILSMTSIYGASCTVEALQESMETKIRLKVQKWRARVKTVWNRYCSTLLRETLPQWEHWACNSTEPRPEPGHRLKQLMVTYKMFGFPLNMPYTNVKNVLATVKASAIHANEDAKVEFALAVRAFAYPSSVISVWVYFVSITRI